MDPDDPATDAQLEVAISVASEAIAGPDALGREPWWQRYRELVPGTASKSLCPSMWPVGSVESVTVVGGDAVETTVYRVDGGLRDKVYRCTGAWALPCNDNGHPMADRQYAYALDYYAGWLLPGTVTEWASGTAYAVGDWVKSGSVPLRFRATVAGTSDATVPTWPDEGVTVVDNGVTWLAVAAEELPQALEHAAILTALGVITGGDQRGAGVKSEAVDGARIEYTDDHVVAVPGAAAALCARWRS